MNRAAISVCLLSVLALSPQALARDEAVAKPVKTVIAAVRQGRDSLALKHFASEEQGKLLTSEYWAKATDAQRKEFISLFQTLFAKIAFPKIRENFKNLDTILYEPAKVEGDRARLSSTILINHPLKKQELKAKYELVNDHGWKIVDVTVLGDSMLQGIRDDQILPLLKEGGWEGLLKAMRDKAKELEKVPLK